MRARSGALALVACVGLLALASSPAAAHNLQPFGSAPGPCTPGQTTPCTFNSRCAQMSFSPHLVHVGEDIDSSAGPAVDACGPGGIPAISWGWGAYDGLDYVNPCPDGRLSHCRFKATGPTLVDVPGSSTPNPGFTIGCIDGGSGFGDWMSCDYYGVIGAKDRAISGSVQTKRGKPVGGVDITISGPSGGTVKTNSNGDYYAVVDPGHYRVSVTGVRDTIAFCSGGENGAVCDLNLTTSDGQADFTAPPDTIELHFSPSHVTADGTGHFTGTVDVINSAGQPAVGTDVKLAPPLDADPLALVCAGGKVLYPQLLSDGSPLGSAFTLTTDDNGQIPLTIWPGTSSGHWLFDASETADSSVSNSASFPFDARPAAHFPPPDTLATELYNAVRATRNTTQVKIFWQFDQLFSPEAVNQDFLLQFLIASGRSYFPGTDFGPVNYAGHAGVLFYPQGSTTPTAGPTGVLDLRDAIAIVNAAATGAPVPPANDVGRSLQAWAMYVSGATTPPPVSQTLGPLAPWTGDEYAYFGFPYPQSALNAPGQVQFYNSCAAPDGTPQIVQTHSPVSLVFRSSSGVTFGLDPSGNPTGNGTGIVFRGRDQTTYVVPAGLYPTMSVTGTGNGTAHVEVFGVVGSPLTAYARKISNYGFRARKGMTGVLALNFFGPAGGLVYAGHAVKQQFGLPMQLGGLPRRLRHGKRTLRLTVTSFGTPIAHATVTVRFKGHVLVSSTDSRGRSRVRPKLPKGKLRIAVAFPGAATVRQTLQVR